jgi:hypothetical protein
LSKDEVKKIHDFVDNSQEGMKHQTRAATQAQQGMTFRITLLSGKFWKKQGLQLKISQPVFSQLMKLILRNIAL